MSRWRAILNGSTADAAQRAITKIAHDLRSSKIEILSYESRNWHSLGFGLAGVSLFFSYLAATCEDNSAKRTAGKLLDRAIAGLREDKMVPGFFKGFLGVAWAAAHTRRLLEIEEDDSGLFEEIDNALEIWSTKVGTPAEFLTGRSAICIYATERSRRSLPAKLLDRVVTDLEAQKVSLSSGTTWPVSRPVMRHLETDHPDLLASPPSGIHSINVSHGTSGIAGSLAALCSKNVLADRCSNLVEAAVRWILAQRQEETPEEFFQSFPTLVGLELPKRLCTGWCNGDLGISIVLFNISRILRHSGWLEFSLSLARKEAMKGLEAVEPHNRGNYGFCHGSAGRAHVFNRFFQETHEQLFARAARFWIERTLSLADSTGGIGGFWLDEPLEGTRSAARGLLTGAAGLGLVLLAATTDTPPEWDRLFLVSF
jgi:lantibiotic modifying enzyme